VIAGMVVLQTFMVIVNTAGVPARAAFPEGAGEMKLFPHKMAATLLSGVLRVIPTPDLSWD